MEVNSNLKFWTSVGFECMASAFTQLQSISIFFRLAHFMITSFFYRDYTRPDLPSGPNESPFAGADIAGLAALGKQILFFGCFQKCTCQCIYHIFKIT